MDVAKLWQLSTPYLSQNDFGVAHTQRVFEIAKQHFPVKPELEDLTYASIILHDIGGSSIKDQYEKGPQIATQILKQLDFPEEFIMDVCMIIGTHHEHPACPTEPFRVLYDSDKLAMFSPQEYPYYNSREGFDWEKIVDLIYSEKGKELSQENLRQRRKENPPRQQKVFFRQIQKHGDNFSYLIADPKTHEAAVVDSSYNAGEIIKIIKAKDLTLKYVINTHGHSDHTAGNTELQQIFGAKVVAHRQSRVQRNLVVDDSDVLQVGDTSIRVLYTPGHTPDGICLLVDGGKLLTGDTLFVGECGRTDLPGGNAKLLYDSLFNKLMKLDDKIEVYPGHDYGPTASSTIGTERKTNYVLKPRSLKEFLIFMNQP